MSKPPSSNRRWVWVLPSLFLDFIVIALPAGVLPILINEHYGKASYLLLGQAAAAKGVLQFLTSPTLGALSDILGRKWLFLACVIGTASPFAALGLHASLDFHLVLLGLSGLLGATFPLAFAFIADHVSAKERASAFGLAIGTGLGLAYLLGPPLGAAIDRYYGPQAVFNVCAGVLLANILLTACGVREEVRRTPTPPTDQLLRKANPFAAFWMARRKPAMRRLSLIVLFYYFSLWGFVANKSIYARRRFGQSSAQTAAQLSTFGLSSVLAQSVGLRLARQVYTEPEIARRCFACGVAALFLYGAAWEVWMLYVPMVLLGLSLGGFATVSSICSQVVSADAVGEAQGVIASMKAIMEGVGPLAFAALLRAFEETRMPGMPWAIGAASMAFSLSLCYELEHYTSHRHVAGARALAKMEAPEREREIEIGMQMEQCASPSEGSGGSGASTESESAPMKAAHRNGCSVAPDYALDGWS